MTVEQVRGTSRLGSLGEGFPSGPRTKRARVSEGGGVHPHESSIYSLRTQVRVFFFVFRFFRFLIFGRNLELFF
jgi:hypothetical protein